MNSNFQKGKDVKIFPFAKIIHKADNFIVDDFAQIDDFVFINAGIKTCIGKFTHISSFVSIIGGGEFILEDFAGLSAGCRIVTGSDDFSGGYLSNPTIPSKFKNVTSGSVTIRRHALIGSNCVILPGVIVGEGATVGAGSIITKDLEAWGVYAGYNPKKVGVRPKENVLSLEAKLLAEFYG